MIGRKSEIEMLRRAYESDQSEFVAVYGRRRIGKTYLVDELFGGRFVFHVAGIEGASRREQLDAFRQALRLQGHRGCPRLNSWVEAFAELAQFLQESREDRKVVFVDELPWFDTPRSHFLKAFENFWNGWASLRKDMLLVICGSATTWIINKILQNRGGLHNRVTRQLPLEPFTLAECEAYAAYRGLPFDRSQIMECYMALGGVAYYWSLLIETQSAAENIDRLFFGRSDEMRREFTRLFASLFQMQSRHIEIVTILGKRRSGLTRDEMLLAMSGISGGDLSSCLTELETCGFIRHYNLPGRRKKGAIYQLMDNYLIFYFTFLHPLSSTDPHYWSASTDTLRLNAWRGLAFERICLQHAIQIRRALGVEGIVAEIYAWRGCDASGQSAQIDLLLDRSDRTISVCEIKYSNGPYAWEKDDAEKLSRRIEIFKSSTGTTKAIQRVVISPRGLSVTKYRGTIQRLVTLEDLFAQ